MKLLTSVLTISIATSVTFLSFIGCKTAKKNSKKDIIINILLEEEKGVSYIQKKYSDYKPEDVKRSNKTLNEYRANFKLNKVEKRELLKKLEEDPDVLLAKIANNSGLSVQSRKRRKTAKAKPKF